ncbi:dr1-associated corepressor-like isoform X2 [Gordionus sp. m RMFG-2023]|uniref:dr1-associated corepressor-like isoform X2 n=1 Tax=Gordionus sp. m RMFG-2023 TaxID=3053472 RepID=UPI0031FD33E8
MPSKRKKFDSRFPAAKIKKIMQLDENIGKVASTVPIVISQALESFLKCFLLDIVDKNPNQRVKTLSPQLVKESTLQNPRWNFLEKLMASVPDQKQSNIEERFISR